MDTDLHRRAVVSALLKGAALGLAGLPLGGCESWLQKIRNRPMRRDLATLAPNDPIIDAYKAAVAAMKALPASDPRNWSRQADIHLNFCPHGNWYFLPWHRAYLLYFEQICRQLSGHSEFALPYWNWTCNRSIPGVFFGGSANPLFDGTRTRGPSDLLPVSWVGPSVISAILAETNFLIFASGATSTQRGSAAQGPLESNPHNNVHGWISGNMGAFRSPLDPVFWTHHNMIDRIWWDWNVVMGHANSNDPAWYDFNFAANFVAADGTPVDIKAGATILGPLLLYQFDQSSITSCGRTLTAFEIDARALRRFLESGAPVRLQTLRRLQSTGPVEIPVGRSATQVLRARDAIALAEADLPPDVRVLVRADVGRQPPSGDFFVRVFVNRPDATADTPVEDPHYAGSFGFFNDDKMPHAGHAGHGGALFTVDATEAVRRLRAMDRVRAGAELELQVVAVPMPGRTPTQRTLSLAGLQLELVQSISAAARPYGKEAQR